jgi:DNA-binding transcriptional ArsR family regulator
MSNTSGQSTATESAVTYIANAEKKCALELLVEPGETVTARELNERFADIQDPSNRVVYGSLGNLATNISNSHRKAGTFDAPAVVRYSTWEATKAEDTKIADAVAGGMLGLSAEFQLSLERLWGISAGGAEGRLSGPQRRIILFKALAELAEGESVSLVELSKLRNISHSAVEKHIRRLYAHGFVDYSPVGSVKQPITMYEIVGDPRSELGTQFYPGDHVRPQWGGEPKLRPRVGQALAGLRDKGVVSFTRSNLQEMINQDRQAQGEDDALGTREIKKESLLYVLGQMLREGVLVREGQWPMVNQVGVNSIQKRILSRTSSMVQGIERGDSDVIEGGIARGLEIISDPALMTSLLRRGYDHSSAVRH